MSPRSFPSLRKIVILNYSSSNLPRQYSLFIGFLLLVLTFLFQNIGHKFETLVLKITKTICPGSLLLERLKFVNFYEIGAILTQLFVHPALVKKLWTIDSSTVYELKKFGSIFFLPMLSLLLSYVFVPNCMFVFLF